uniref:Uncharacterized protein n=1 Tax=Rhizophora mucronata TaxID=61149 RepID=A0A2P2IXG9_RHIMU
MNTQFTQMTLPCKWAYNQQHGKFKKLSFRKSLKTCYYFQPPPSHPKSCRIARTPNANSKGKKCPANCKRQNQKKIQCTDSQSHHPVRLELLITTYFNHQLPSQ